MILYFQTNIRLSCVRHDNRPPVRYEPACRNNYTHYIPYIRELNLISVINFDVFLYCAGVKFHQTEKYEKQIGSVIGDW
jgi:hypothetical protein